MIDYLIPHKKNGHHPHVLKHRSLAAMSALLIGLKGVALALPLLVPGATLADSLAASAIQPLGVVEQTNIARLDHGLATLEVDDRLSKAAQRKARDMATRSYFAHVSPDGQSALELIRVELYPVRFAAENLAVHFSHSSDVRYAWMQSPSHRSNILDPRYTDIGVGVAQGVFEGRETTFVVQLLGSPTDLGEIVTSADLVTATYLPADNGNGKTGKVLAGTLTTDDVDMVSREITLYAVAFLTAVLMLTLAIRFRWKHAASVSHATAVIGLACILMLA